MKIRKIGVLTSGGDAPGMNPCIRAVVRTAISYEVEVIGIQDGYDGCVRGEMRPLKARDVGGILQRGGTILQTARCPAFHTKKGRLQALRELNEDGIEGLIIIGGDGSMRGAHALVEMGFPVVGIPASIDNDMWGTNMSLGVDTAMNTIMDAVDKLRDTASSHQRAFVIETMGRYAGWIALAAGVASGGDVILIPEIPYDLEVIARRVLDRSRRGKRFSIAVVAEGAKPLEGEMVVDRVVEESTDPWRLGGVGRKLALDLENKTGLECRVTVLGHLQRGGSPVPADRILATQFGYAAADLAAAGEFGKMVALRDNQVVSVEIAKAVAQQKLVPRDHPWIAANKALGVCFGDE